jgi:excinuclease ABC subunit B
MCYKPDISFARNIWNITYEAISLIDPLRSKKFDSLRRMEIYPGSHYVTTKENLKRAIGAIRQELGERLRELNAQSKFLDAWRLEQRDTDK